MRWGYVAQLMANVPPQVLGDAVLRRVSRSARGALDRLRSPISEREILSAFGVSTEAALARVFARGRPRALWCHPAHADGLRQLAKRHPHMQVRALARAERARMGRWDAFGLEVALDSPEVYRRDPRTGFLFAGSGEPPALPKPGVGDPKRVWTLARADWAVALAQGAWLQPARSAEFAARFAALADALLVETAPGEGIHAVSAMEVSLRAMNLAFALCMFGDALDGGFVLRALRSIADHAAFAHAHLEDSGAVPNNHLVAGLVGLLNVAAMLPELAGARAWKANASERLTSVFPRQVLEDGMGFEGSTGYHRLLLELGVLALLAARATGDRLAAELAPHLARMALASRELLHCGGTAPQIGDCDSGRALALTDRAPLDFSYLSPLCAALLDDARLHPPDAELPDEAAWLLGPTAADAFEAQRPTGASGSSWLRHFGLAVLRRGRLSLALRAGPLGQGGVGGHGHNDALSFELYRDTSAVIVDGGTWSYLGDPAGRDRFRGTGMHSTVQLDGAEQSPIPPDRPFALPDRSQARILEVNGSDELDRARARHDGYAPVTHSREVMLGDDAAVIVDDLEGAGLHALVSRFHLATTEARIRPLGEGERARLPGLPLRANWDADAAVEIGPPEAPLAVLVIARGPAVALSECAHSPAYDQRVAARCIEVSLTAELPVRLAAAVLFNIDSRPATAG